MVLKKNQKTAVEDYKHALVKVDARDVAFADGPVLTGGLVVMKSEILPVRKGCWRAEGFHG